MWISNLDPTQYFLVLHAIWSLYSELMFYIQFGPYIHQFLLKWSNFVPLQIETKFTFYIKIHIFIKYFCLGLQLV